IAEMSRRSGRPFRETGRYKQDRRRAKQTQGAKSVKRHPPISAGEEQCGANARADELTHPQGALDDAIRDGPRLRIEGAGGDDQRHALHRLAPSRHHAVDAMSANPNARAVSTVNSE